MSQQKEHKAPAIPTDDILKLLKDYLEMQKKAQENLKRKDLKMGGVGKAITDGIFTGLKYMRDVNPINSIDKKIDYSYLKQSTPDVKKILSQFRSQLASGGSVTQEHIDQLMMLIGALEGGAGPQNWLEADMLLDLKKELEQVLQLEKK